MVARWRRAARLGGEEGGAGDGGGATAADACGWDAARGLGGGAPNTSSPEHAAGSRRDFCSCEPLRMRLLTNNWEWARYERQKAGSEALSSSCTMHAASASMPLPPYSGSTVTPSRPSSPQRRKRSWLKRSARLYSSACGSTSASVKEATISRKARCSSLGLNGSAAKEGDRASSGCAADAVESWRACRSPLEQEASASGARRAEVVAANEAVVIWARVAARAEARIRREAASAGHERVQADDAAVRTTNPSWLLHDGGSEGPGGWSR